MSSPATVPSIEKLPRRDIALRASVEADRHFLQRVFESTREEEFRSGGFDEPTLRVLLASQFSAQDAYYRRHYPRGRFDVVFAGHVPVGRFYHDWDGAEARIIDIALMPACRGSGIGTALMYAAVADAARRGMCAILYVESGNPVQALYRRLGFEQVGENGVYALMHREPAPFDPGPGWCASLSEFQMDNVAQD